MAAHQATPSLGFSRQEHWSGLPFPSPMHASEVAQSCPTLSDTMDCSLPGSSVGGIFQARALEWVPSPSPSHGDYSCVIHSTLSLCAVAQSCLTFCNPMDCNLPGSSFHWIFQTRILEWVAISSSRDLLNPGTKPPSPAAPPMQTDSLLAEP